MSTEQTTGPLGSGLGSGFSRETEQLLDKAAEYEFQHHRGGMEFEEQNPGDFWSIQIQDVHKAFGSNRVLRGLNVGFPEGMITVLLGPSGTGKSVLFRHMIGLMFPDAGDVVVHGRSVPDMTMSELLEVRKLFGIMFQDGALFGSMNLFDNVAFPLRQHTEKSEAEIRDIVEYRLDEVGLAGFEGVLPHEISGGMRKRVSVARALVLEPHILMFDEPDSGLDPVRTALLCELIKKIHAEHGGTFIVVTHDIATARRIGNHVCVMWRGRLVEGGERDEMLNSDNPFVRQFLNGAAEGPLGMTA